MHWTVHDAFYLPAVRRGGMRVQGAKRADPTRIEKAIVLPLGAEEEVNLALLHQWLQATAEKQRDLDLSVDDLAHTTPPGQPSIVLAIVAMDNSVVFYRLHCGMALPSDWLNAPSSADQEDGV